MKRRFRVGLCAARLALSWREEDRVRWEVRDRTGQGADGAGRTEVLLALGAQGRPRSRCAQASSRCRLQAARQEPHGLRVSLFLNPSPTPWEIMKKTEQMNTNETCFFEDRET